MLKLNFFVVFCLSTTLLLTATKASPIDDLADLVNPEKLCPSYSSMSNLDLSKLLGVWYDFAYSSAQGDKSDSCVKIQVSLNANGTVQMAQSQIEIDGTPSQEPVSLFTLDPTRPGDLFKAGSNDKSSPWSVLYTDYDNITTFFRCAVDDSHVLPKVQRKFFISLKSRTFDSMSKFLRAIAPLKELGVDLDDMEFYYNGPNCKN